MSKYYCATFVDKFAEVDEKDNGCTGERSCIIAEQCDIRGTTIPKLLRKIADRYGYDGDCWHVPEDGGWIYFSQFECAEGNALDPDETERFWDTGKKVYLCDYSFAIEFRDERSVSEGELRDAVSQAGAKCV